MTPDTKSEVSGGRQDLTVAARTGPGPSSAGKVGPGTPTPTPVPAAPAPLVGVGVVWKNLGFYWVVCFLVGRPVTENDPGFLVCAESRTSRQRSVPAGGAGVV